MTSTADILHQLHPNEELNSLLRRILDSLSSLHISCGRNCLEVTKCTDDFIGICLFYSDGSAVLEDKGKRIRSGYIFAERSSALNNVHGNTMHRRAYNLMFDEIEKKEGVVIVGFAQQKRMLKGISRIFNHENTNVLPLAERDGNALFSLRTLIFGSIIVHKINGIRNVTPHSACLAMCLFLIVKADGDKEDMESFPVSDIDLDNQEIFLREFFGRYKIQEDVLKVAFKDEMVTSGLGKRRERWTRAKRAMKQLVEGFQADLTADQFSSFMRNLSAKYSDASFIGSILVWLLRVFFGG